MTNEETNTDVAVAEPGAHGAPEKASSKKRTSQKKGPPKGQKTAKAAKAKAAAPKKKAQASKRPAKAPQAKAATPDAESKGGKILGLIKRSKGATLAEIRKATGWQAHSVRGFLSTAAKKHGIRIESAKNEAGERTYSSKN